MVVYRCSPMRNKGWLRMALVGAVAMIPLAGIEYSLGSFSAGLAGVEQAGEFLSSGITLMLIIGLAGGWVARGFAYRARDEDEEADEPATSRSGGPPAMTGGRPPSSRPARR